MFNQNFVESNEYLDSTGYGYFSFLLLKQGIPLHEQRERMQFAYPLSQLPELLPEFIAKANAERKNLFISQATFRKKNRQRASFLSVGCLFVDLDIYHGDMQFRFMTKEKIAEKVHEICEIHCIPQPSVIIDSGGGMYLKWFIKDAIFKHALSYWEAVQERLNNLFAFMGADSNAIDVSRVLRLVGSTNYKYPETPLCRVMRVDYENLSATRIKKYALVDFQQIMQYTLDEAQVFNERMAKSNSEFSRNGATIKREKHNRLLILETLKELDEFGQLEGINPEKLNNYIKEKRNLKRFSLKDCSTYLTRFLKKKDAYEKKFQRNNITNNNVIYSQNRFNLVRRNWGLYQDIIELAEHRYGSEGVPDGLRDAFMFTACAQYSLSRWSKSTVEDIQATYRTIGNILVPHWTENRIDNCLQALTKRLKLTKEGEFSLYRFSDSYLHNMLNVTSDELQILGADGHPLIKQMLGEDERNRRDPERLQKKVKQDRERKRRNRRSNGMQSRSDYEGCAADKVAKAKDMKAKGMKNAEIAEELGVHVKSVSRLLKR